MKTSASEYTALVALDWGDQEHAFALQHEGPQERGTIAATPESLHRWLEQLAPAAASNRWRSRSRRAGMASCTPCWHIPG